MESKSHLYLAGPTYLFRLSLRDLFAGRETELRIVANFRERGLPLGMSHFVIEDSGRPRLFLLGGASFSMEETFRRSGSLWTNNDNVYEVQLSPSSTSVVGDFAIDVIKKPPFLQKLCQTNPVLVPYGNKIFAFSVFPMVVDRKLDPVEVPFQVLHLDTLECESLGELPVNWMNIREHTVWGRFILVYADGGKWFAYDMENGGGWYRFSKENGYPYFDELWRVKAPHPLLTGCVVDLGGGLHLCCVYPAERPRDDATLFLYQWSQDLSRLEKFRGLDCVSETLFHRGTFNFCFLYHLGNGVVCVVATYHVRDMRVSAIRINGFEKEVEILFSKEYRNALPEIDFSISSWITEGVTSIFALSERVP